MTKIKGFHLFLVVFAAVAAISHPAAAYEWTVGMPADVPYVSCRVQLYGKCPDFSTGNIAPGGQHKWSPPGNASLSFVLGTCTDTYGNKVDLQTRTCDGQDIPGNAVSGQLACNADIKLKICKKKDQLSVLPYSYGFCPQ